MAGFILVIDVLLCIINKRLLLFCEADVSAGHPPRAKESSDQDMVSSGQRFAFRRGVGGEISGQNGCGPPPQTHRRASGMARSAVLLISSVPSSRWPVSPAQREGRTIGAGNVYFAVKAIAR